MKKQVSPFEKMTCGEKQLKWLEMQSFRLPYTEGSIDAQPITKTKNPERNEEKKPEVPEKKPETPKENMAPAPRQLYPQYMKPRHSQYDAVINRLKQAQAKAGGYTKL